MRHFSDVGIYDRTVVQDVIKSMAQSQQLDTGTQKQFKVVVLIESDRLTKEAQHGLRRTMEKYAATCRLILLCTSTGKLIAPLRSRCLAIRVGAPNQKEIINVMHKVCCKERVELPAMLASRIAEKCEGNLRRALLMLETCKMQNFPMMDDQSISEPDWEIYIRETGQLILREQTPANLLKIRERLYEVLSRCIPATILFKKLLAEIIVSCDAALKVKTTEFAAIYEHRLQKGEYGRKTAYWNGFISSKAIFHLEAFVVNFMAMYKSHLDDALMDFE